MKKLHFGAGLDLPLDFVTQTQAILAKKRVGKSYTASVQAEELLKAGQQIVVIDPTGAWWGLKSSADGKLPGFPIAIFGGEHADVPLEESAGEVVAAAIVEQRFSAILDLTLFRKSQITRFMAPFLETLYRLNREAMHLFVDEADAIAPQRPFNEEARMLGAMEDVVRRGGIRGIGCTMITQRPAVLNKNVLTQAEILTVLRIVHHKDIAAIEEWVAVHGDEKLMKELKDSLPSLPIGTAWVWSPGWGDIFQQVKIRERETFDSGATPKAGQIVKAPKAVAAIDILKLGEKISATVERQKENDPKALKSKIAELQKALTKQGKVVTPDQSAIDRAEKQGRFAAEKEFRAALAERERIIASQQKTLASIATLLGKPLELPKAIAYTPVPTTAPRQAPIRIVKPHSNGAPPPEGISASQVRILSRLEELLQCTGAASIRKEHLAAWAEYSPNSGGFNNYLGSLRSSGLIEYPTPGFVSLTDLGREIAKPEDVPTNSEEILERSKRVLGGSEARILEHIHARAQEPISKVELAEATEFSANSGGFNNYLGHMRTLGFIEYPQKGMVKCADWMFL